MYSIFTLIEACRQMWRICGRRQVKKEIINYGRINFFYVVIAKREIFDTPNNKLREEFRNLLLKNEKNI